jgi:hypothetical protein
MAATTLPADLILEELDCSATLRALGIKNIPGFPIPHILTRTFHGSSPFI